eukprot:2451022-Pyramimonas_sp.AAC.1
MSIKPPGITTTGCCTPVAAGSGGIRAVTKTAQIWNTKPANVVGVAPLAIQESLQALVDEWSVYWGIVAPRALP